MERERVIVEILAVGVMNHGPSTVERANRSRDFGGKTNKSISPLSMSLRATSFPRSATVRVR